MIRLVRWFNNPKRPDPGAFEGFGSAKIDALMDANGVETAPVARQGQIPETLLQQQNHLDHPALYRQMLA